MLLGLTGKVLAMRKSWGAVLLFLAIIALPCFILVKNIGINTTGTLLLSFIALMVIPGFLVISMTAPQTSTIGRLVIGSVIGFALFALGGFTSGWTGIFLFRFLPSAAIYGLSIFFLIKEKGLSRFNFFVAARQPENTSVIFLSSAVGALALFAGVMVTLGTQSLTWDDSWSYYTDLPWQIAMTAETGQRAPEFFPYVAGTNLAYPFGFHSFAGVWESVSTATAAQLVLQVWPVLYFVLLPLTVSVVTFRISKSFAATMLATLLVATFGGLALAPGSIYTWFPQYPISPTLEFSTLVLLALIWCVVEFVYQSQRMDRIPGWIVIFTLSFLAATSKGSTWAILILFLGFASIFSWFYKENFKHVALTLGVSGVGVLLGLISVVRSSGGLTLNFLKLSNWNYSDQALGYSTLLVIMWGIALAVLVLITNTPHKLALASASLSLSVAAAVNLFMEHPGGSEVYFYLSAIPLFLVVFSIALVQLAKSMGWLIALPFGLNFIWWQVTQLYTPSGLSKEQLVVFNLISPLFIGMLGTIAVITWVNFPKLGKISWVTLLFAISVLSTIGYQPAAVKAPVFSGQDQVDAVPFTAPERDLLLQLKQASSKEDTVATNIHCLSTSREIEQTTDNCDARSFAVSAFAERRTLIEGWAYTPNGPTYWNPALLEANDGFFTRPSSEGAKKLAAEGVKWLFVDEQLAGSQEFSDYADLEYRNEFGSIWRLK